jgi:crotonobetainyl-CoA:carnitine CoA-transferase CaiB-like acyl-CoA transferase
MINTPIRLAGTPGNPNHQPPLLGEHNTELLCTIGGLSPAELEELEGAGLV